MKPLNEMTISELNQAHHKLGLQVNVGRNKLGKVVFALTSERI